MRTTGPSTARPGTVRGHTRMIESDGGRCTFGPPAAPCSGGSNRARSSATCGRSLPGAGMTAAPALSAGGVARRRGAVAERGPLAERGGAGARERGLPAADHPGAGGARRGGADARGTALPAFRCGGPSVLRHVERGRRAEAARRGGPPGVALARREVTLPDAAAPVDRPSDRRRGRRAARGALGRRGGAGGGLVRVSA